MELSVYQYLFLIFGATLAGLVDSIAGGGGIISIPVLLSVGIPPHAAIATNKLQGTFGAFTSMMRYRHSGLVSLRRVFLGIIFTAIGATTGAILIQTVDASALSKIIPFVLLALLIYTVASPKLGEDDTPPKMAEPLFFICFGLLIGFYDGFFGPGTGSFWTIAFATLAGYNLKKATAATKAMNFTSNFISLVIFLLSGKVLILVGLLMGGGQFVGSWIGTHLVITRGTKFIRVFFITMVAATIINLFIKQYF